MLTRKLGLGGISTGRARPQLTGWLCDQMVRQQFDVEMAVGADDVLSAVAETARNYPSHIILEEPCARTERSLRTALTAPECLYHLAICNFVHRQHFERFAALPGNNKSFRNILSYFSN